jgi:integrase/recombinase XerC
MESPSVNISLNSILESYIRNYADGDSHTARAKRLDLEHFVKFLLRYCGYSRPEKLLSSDWSNSTTKAFIEEKLRTGESPATVARRLATLKHLGRVAAETIPNFKNPAKEVKTPKLATAKPQGLDKKEITSVAKKCELRIDEKGSFIRKRNRFLVLFILETGLRAEEVRLLRMNQFDEKWEWIKNVRTKGKRYRNVYINSDLRDHLLKYIELRNIELTRICGKVNKNTDRMLPLFISSYRADISDPETLLMGVKSIWRAVNEVSSEKSLHPHLLRHSFALNLLDSSNDIRLVAQALGHGDVRITMKYTERSAEQVAEALEKRKDKSTDEF